MLQATLQWRLDAKPHAITWADVEAEAASGKNFVSPFPDRAGRPVVLMRPRNQNTGGAFFRGGAGGKGGGALGNVRRAFFHSHPNAHTSTYAHTNTPT
jgi:hypothetical protein